MSSPSSHAVGRKGKNISLNKDQLLNELKELILASEERMKSWYENKMDAFHERLTKVESTVNSLLCERVEISDEITKIKKVVVQQQLKIEEHEEKLRASNLIFHNIPEGMIRLGKRVLDTDDKKVEFVCEAANIDIRTCDISFLRRLGKKGDREKRPLKISLKDKNDKFKVLNKRKDITQSQDIQSTFGQRIFVNNDSSFLVRKEEYRLRQEMKRLRSSYPGEPIFLRAGSLYHNDLIVDKINIENSLF